jgi:alpha-glucosidase
VELRTATGAMRIEAVEDSIIRVRVAPGGVFPRAHSFAVVPEAIAAMKPSSTPRLAISAQRVEVATASFRALVDRATSRLRFLDAQGNVLSEDDPNRPLRWSSYTLETTTRMMRSSFTDPERAAKKRATQFQMWKLMPEDEHYFGLGDKAGPLSRRNMAFTMWNTDAFGWQESTDPLYKSIPFFVALRGGRSYGVFVDNTYRVSYDFGKTARESYAIGSDDGPIDYFFIHGPEPKKVIERYTALTGRTPMPPMWSLGFQQCRYSYFPETRVREIAETFRQKRIPLDAIYLDIDYQLENRPFSVDPQRFPSFAGMLAEFNRRGLKTILITDLHIWKGSYPPYQSGVAGDHFVKNPDGSTYVGPVWPGPSVFPDFTAGAKAREWWGSLYRDFVAQGVGGFWNDMNEPAVFERADKTMPLDTVHRVELPGGGVREADHREIHNVVGMENLHATFEGMLRLRPDARPFVLTRAGFAGAQRYGATWNGDNSSSWNHLRLSVTTLLNLGISGWANVGTDIGGFWGDASADLLTRWQQVGAFMPMYRNHTVKGSADQEPWVHGPKHEAINRKYIELRYRLMPYLYTAFEENVRTGVPVMRAMFLEYPEMGDNGEEFLFGRDILVAPAVWEMLPDIEVELPGREGWYDYWSNQFQEGGKTIKVKSRVEEMPVFVRAGAIVPHMPVVQNMEQKPDGPLEVRVYAPRSGSSDCSGSLYLDDGKTFAFQRGEQNWLRLRFNCEHGAGALTLKTESRGGFVPWWNRIEVQVVGGKQPAAVTAGDQRLPATYENGVARFTIPPAALNQPITIRY